MCVIAVSKAGVKQPTKEQLETMFKRNPHGAGYMYAKDGKVTIHKGFMDFKDFYRAVCNEHFGKDDAVVYHFRISTQAGVNPRMTHPFPLTKIRENCEKLDVRCTVGIAHNGIIRMTSDAKETRFSDTVIFITDYMTKLIRDRADITDSAVREMIDNMTNSKWAIMDGVTGEIVTIGQFINDGGLLFSNSTYTEALYGHKYTIEPPKKFNWDDYYEGYYGVRRELAR